MKRVGIYLRVSTTNGQTTDNQRRELEAVARRSGWDVVEIFEDMGISGAKGRDQRPGRRIDAGLARANARGVNRKGEPLRLGRPPVNTATERDIRKRRAKSMGILKIAKTLGIGTSACCCSAQRGTDELNG